MATFIDGFEQFDGDRVGTLMRMAGYSLSSLGVVAGRAGGKAILLYRSSVTRDWAMAGQMLSVGFAVKFDQRGPLVALSGGGQSFYVWVDPDTGLLNTGTSVTAGAPGYMNPLKDRWYFLEMTLNRDNNTLSLYLNGKSDSTVTLPAFLAGTIQVKLNPFDLFTAKQDYGTRVYDDLYLVDGARLGPIQVSTRFPTGDGDKPNWSVTGAANNWQAVRPEINELDKFIFTAIDGNENNFVSIEDVQGTAAIRYLQLITMFRKATSDPMSLIFNIDEQKVTEVNISRNWTFRYTMFNASGYTPSNIKAAQFGVKLKLGA